MDARTHDLSFVWTREHLGGFSRPVIEEYPALDVRWLARTGLLGGSQSLEWSDGSILAPKAAY